MSIEELKQYIKDKISDINSRYPDLISDEEKEQFIISFIDSQVSPGDLEVAKKKIDLFHTAIIEKQERLERFRKELDEETQNRKDKLEGVDRSFGEVYKSYVIHILSIYEEIVNDDTISDDKKEEVYNSRVQPYLVEEREKKMAYLMQQIKDPNRVEIAKREMFLGCESLTFETAGNLYNTFVNDLTVIANDSEGKMLYTVSNDKPLEFDNEGNLLTKINYHFEDIKEIYDFAKKHGKQVKYHTLLWHNAVPENLRQTIDKVSNPSLKRKMALSFIKDYTHHLKELVFNEENRYDLQQLEVLNEIACDEHDKGVLRDSWWKDVIGEDYYIEVLKIVREEFPDTELIYNDYNEYSPYKCRNICAIVKHIRKIEQREGIKLLDGLGLQAHYSDYLVKNGTLLTASMIQETALEYLKLGIPIYITEFDFNIISGKETEALVQAFLQYYVSVANGFNMWGNSDHLTWRFTMKDGEFLNSHMVDVNGVPKEIYYLVMQQMGFDKNFNFDDNIHI